MFVVGAWDALSAKLVESAGFEAVYMSGTAVANTLIGKTDLGYVTQTETLDTARRITQSVSVPVIIDADDGFGSSLNVQRTIRLCEQAGVAGLHFDDVETPKRSPRSWGQQTGS